MRSDVSTNNIQFNRKSVISSHSTGSSNNEVINSHFSPIPILNSHGFSIFLPKTQLRQLVLHLQQTKIIKLHMDHHEQHNNSSSNLESIVHR